MTFYQCLTEFVRPFYNRVSKETERKVKKRRSLNKKLFEKAGPQFLSGTVESRDLDRQELLCLGRKFSRSLWESFTSLPGQPSVQAWTELVTSVPLPHDTIGPAHGTGKDPVPYPPVHQRSEGPIPSLLMTFLFYDNFVYFTLTGDVT